MSIQPEVPCFMERIADSFTADLEFSQPWLAEVLKGRWPAEFVLGAPAV